MDETSERNHTQRHTEHHASIADGEHLKAIIREELAREGQQQTALNVLQTVASLVVGWILGQITATNLVHLVISIIAAFFLRH